MTAVYVGAEKIWPTRETVQITLGTGFQARDQFRAALSARGLDYQTVTEIPFDIELVGTGSTERMFWGCSSLTHVPGMDTSSVTSMSYMFHGCSSLTHVPDMDTGQVTDMDSLFSDCAALTSVPAMDTSGVTGMGYMFSNCSSLTHVPGMDTSQATSMTYMFFGCSSLTSVPDMDTGQVTDMNGMFRECAALTDGNVRLIGRHPQVSTSGMILYSGLTREPFFDADGNPI